MKPIQLRMARILLNMSQSDLAEAATVARATINRYESGKTVGPGQIRLMRIAVEAAGVSFIPDGTEVAGTPIFDAIGMRFKEVTSSPKEESAEDDA